MTPTALITGASQGIGQATALLLASKGYNLILASRNPATLNQLAQSIQNTGQKALPIPTDTRDPQQVQNLIQKALETFPHIDILINNAGICMTGPIQNTTLEDWQNIINTNLWGYIHTIHTLIPHFIQRQQGTIVNVGSFGGKVPLPYMSAYCTSKYAITGLTETLRLELAPQNIHICAVHPSATNSDFLQRAIFRGKDQTEANQRQQQMHQLLQTPIASKPQDVALAIWEAITHKKAEIVVGSAAPIATAYQHFPSLLQWLMQQTTKTQQKT